MIWIEGGDGLKDFDSMRELIGVDGLLDRDELIDESWAWDDRFEW